MKFYVTLLVNKVTGYENFTENEYCYSIMSSVPWLSDPNKLMLHPITEPYMMILIENHFVRWQNQRRWHRQHPAEQTLPKRTTANKTMDIFVSKYSTQDGGQKRWGGWGAAGIGRFNQLVGEYVQAKYEDPANPGTIKAAWVAWERSFLTKLKAELGLQGNNAQEERRLRAGENNAVVPPAQQNIPQAAGLAWNL